MYFIFIFILHKESFQWVQNYRCKKCSPVGPRGSITFIMYGQIARCVPRADC